jgi:hypothetical protein
VVDQTYQTHQTHRTHQPHQTHQPHYSFDAPEPMPIGVSLPHRTLATAVLTLLVVTHIYAGLVSAQTSAGVVRGEVTDVSGGVLPGVTVVATTPDGQVIQRVITNEVGQYVFPALRSGPVKLVFELDGFATTSVTVIVKAGVEVAVIERLKLARMTEEVIVYGKAPVDPPPPLPRYEPPVPPTVIAVPARDLETVCRPARPGGLLGPLGTIQSHRYAFGRTLYSKGDELVINGGTLNGLDVGRNLAVLRYFRTNSKAAQFPEVGEHTAGLVQIVSATETTANAVVVHVCNELIQGDLLVSFKPEYVHTPGPVGTPAYDDAARILFAEPGQMMGAAMRLMVIDRGTGHGVESGQRLTLFRRKDADAPRFVLGEGIVISVRSQSATIRVLRSTDAIEFGDWAAPQRQSVAKTNGPPQR